MVVRRRIFNDKGHRDNRVKRVERSGGKILSHVKIQLVLTVL